MADYTRTTIGSGYNSASQLNAELQKIEVSLATKLDNTGDTISGDFDLANNDLLNIGAVDITGLTLNGVTVTTVDSLGTVTVPDSSSVNFTQAGTGADTRSVRDRLRDTVHATDFGLATGNTGAQNTTAIQEALDALEPSSSTAVFYGDDGCGTVYIPSGIYSFDGEITVPEFVNLKGAGKGATVLKASNASAKITYGTTSAAFGANQRGGVSGGFTVDGNDTATGNLFHIGFVVERGFHDIDVVNSLGNGCVIEAAQNLNFHDCGFQHNGTETAGTGSNLVLDYGAGNIRFWGAEVNRPAEYNIKFVQSGTSPSGAFSVPTDVRFYGGMIERWEDSLGTGTLTSSGTIYHGAGRVNRFVDCDISLTQLPSAGSIVVVRKDGSGAGTPLYFHNCSFHGTLLYSTAFDVDDAVTVTLTGKNFFENNLTIFKVGDTSFIDVDKLLLSSYTNLFQNQSGGTKTQDQLVANRNLTDVIVKDVRSAANEIAYTLSVDGETNPRWEWYPNSLSLGGGSGATDTTINRTTQYSTTVLNISQPIKVSGTTAILASGSGSPENVLNGGLGSIYLNTAGGASTSIYVKETGVGTNTGWVAK